MTLNEFMKKADKTEMFNIGCEESWLFIGNKDEYKKTIEKINDEQIKYLQTIITNVDKKIKAFDEIVRPAGMRSGSWGRELIEKGLSLIEKAQRRDVASAKLKSYIHLKNREVIHTDKLLSGNTAVYLEGAAIGKCWLRKEFEEKYLGKEKTEK